MYFNKKQWAILLFTAVYTVSFLVYYLSRANYEFLIYIGVIVFFFALIAYSHKVINYSSSILAGLSIWGLLHLAGGGIPIKGARLYNFMIWKLSDTYSIFRYDQFVHLVGFFVATLVVYQLLLACFGKKFKVKTSLGIIIVMAGLGFGALNEIIEFFAFVILQRTGVGGYINNSLDLVFNLIGAILALVVIKIWESKLLKQN